RVVGSGPREGDRARGQCNALATARVSHLRLARADHRFAPGSWHDGRRCDRSSVVALVDGARGIPRHARGRDLLGQQLVEARSGRGADDREGAAPRSQLGEAAVEQPASHWSRALVLVLVVVLLAGALFGYDQGVI